MQMPLIVPDPESIKRYLVCQVPTHTNCLMRVYNPHKLSYARGDTVTYKGAPESLAFVENYIRKNGPYDGSELASYRKIVLSGSCIIWDRG